MSSQRYERISENDNNDNDDNPMTPSSPQDHQPTPSSPPPSFRSHASSPSSRRLLSSEDPMSTDAERTLADTFDDGSDSDSDANGGDDRQRLMRSTTSQPPPSEQPVQNVDRPNVQRTVTRFPGAESPASFAVPARPYTGATHNAPSNDGVFANLNAKPERGEKLEEQPPSYEAAAADATPPYWETTILAPNHLSGTDEVFVDGLPVGSLFSFVWNGMISMSFQFVGFLLTYLLHTTHAAKNGSRAGLGITLVQYGFLTRSGKKSTPTAPSGGGPPFAPPAGDPNTHDFTPSTVADTASAAAAAAVANQAASSTSSGISSVAHSDWIAYALMIVGWFILIRAVSDFLRARKHEQLVLQSPDRGLNVPVVAEGERVETVV